MATEQTTSDERTPMTSPAADDRTHQRQRQSSAEEEEEPALQYFGGIAVDTKRIQQCCGCGCYILDAGLLRLADDCWHSDCLRCSVCQVKLQDVGTTCFTRAEMILCRSDYIRLFGDVGSTCARCGKAIPSDGLVMRTSGPSIRHTVVEAAAAAAQRNSHHHHHHHLQEPSSSSSSSYEDHHHHHHHHHDHHHHHHHHQSLYHLDCFSCIACDRRLSSGDQYGIIEGNVLCDKDFARFYEVI